MAGNLKLKLKLKEVVNGERSVVFLFVCRVLVSTPLSLLFYEAAALFLLSIAALLVEIFAETNSHSIPTTLFNTSSRRPGGASSGILLGAVTLPTLMLSRLIQFSRSQHQGSEYLDVHQFWAASAASLGVLLVLAISWILPLQQSLRNTSSYFNLQPTSSKASLLTILCAAASYALTCCLSLATKSNTGSYIAINMLWLFFHGPATVLLIHHILQTFPLCASVGEALLVSSGLVLYFGDMLAHTLSKISLLFFSPKLNIVDYGNRSELSTVIQGVLLGLLLLPALYKFVLRIWWHFTILDEHTNQVDERSKIANSILFYISLFVMLTMIVPAWMYFVQDFHEHPVLWVFSFVFSEPLKHLALCIYWISVICASVLRFYNISKHSRVERILLRKYYHLLAVLMFSPALLFQPKFLDLAFGAALAVFLVLEMIRVWKIWPLGYVVHHFMNAFTDHRDSEILIVSHFSLLLGCALPKWMSSGFNDRPLTAFAGILSLGIGDTMASMVGHKYGVLRWSKTGKKTIEGTAAGITSVLAACSVLLPLLASTGYILSQHWLSLLVAVTVSGLLEAYTAQLDNAFIPLVFCSLLCL